MLKGNKRKIMYLSVPTYVPMLLCVMHIWYSFLPLEFSESWEEVKLICM
jgi:hypothetical protein